MALRHSVRTGSTRERLTGAFAAAGGSPADLEELLAAHECFVTRILRQQIADISAGRARLDNSVDISLLTRNQKRTLVGALGRVSILADILPTVLGGR